MKLQNFAVIFIVIILPIALVVSEYTGNLITVANKQAEFDSTLLNSTYDSVRAYQMNTLNNNYESATNSKVRDINASINSFFNSLSTGLSSSRLGKQELKDYIPALLYTLYDGYYVYGAYDNIASISSAVDVNKSSNAEYNTNANFSRKEYGLKPYIYYSCEYAKSGEYDLIVNYTLDNYITVTGTYKDPSNSWKNIALSGYYINYNNVQVTKQDGEPANFSSKTVKLYPGTSKEVVIRPEKLGEYIISYDTHIGGGFYRNYLYQVVNNGNPKYYNYILYNNVKYYLDTEHIGAQVEYDTDRTNNLSFNMTYDGYPIFFLDGDKRTYISKNLFDELKAFLGVTDDSDMYSSDICFKDVNAYYYYYRAEKFSSEVAPVLQKIDLGTETITDENGQTINVISSNIPYDENKNLSSRNVIKTETYHMDYLGTNQKYIGANGLETDNVQTHVKSTYYHSRVFDLSNTDNDPELESSSFNRHRIDVIISSIESSLVTTIANFNSFIGGTYDYTMPVLSELDWDRICNNVTVVSFMQGLTIGNFKYYSSYAIVANTKVKDFISKDTIYVQDSNSNTADYHNPKCLDYKKENHANVIGYRNLDYDRKSCKVPSIDGTGGSEFFYYPQQNPLAYECVVSLNNNIYTTDELINGTVSDGKSPLNQEVRRAYVSALAREKGNGYKTYGFLNEEL